jgi:hypothetical protein
LNLGARNLALVISLVFLLVIEHPLKFHAFLLIFSELIFEVFDP